MESTPKMERTYSMEIGKVKVDISLDAESCLLCANPISAIALGECGHRVICSTCLLRLRWIMKKEACPVCKMPLENLFVTHDLKAKYEDQLANKAALIPDLEDSKIFFDCQDEYERFKMMRGYICPIFDCKKDLHGLKGLDTHLKQNHNRTFCDLCFKHRLVFIGEQLVFPTHLLKDHMKYGENRGDLRIHPHPLCNFCNKNFYSEEPLQNHLEKIHMKCHLCSDKCKYRYYKDYTELEQHFQKTHYLCQHERCKEKCFVVFGTLEELHIHNVLLK